MTHPTRSVSVDLLKRSALAALFTLPVIGLLSLMGVTGCVVKEELGGVYNQARLGLNQWSLSSAEEPRLLVFNLGYLIGLEDAEGVGEFTWRYELMTPRKELIASHEELMREPQPEKVQVFVQGQRQRSLELPRAIEEGERVVLWFTLLYRGERFHEQLFALEGGAEGGSLDWLREWIEQQNLAVGGDTGFNLPDELSAGALSEDMAGSQAPVGGARGGATP